MNNSTKEQRKAPTAARVWVKISVTNAATSKSRYHCRSYFPSGSSNIRQREIPARIAQYSPMLLASSVGHTPSSRKRSGPYAYPSISPSLGSTIAPIQADNTSNASKIQVQFANFSYCSTESRVTTIAARSERSRRYSTDLKSVNPGTTDHEVETRQISGYTAMIPIRPLKSERIQYVFPERRRWTRINPTIASSPILNIAHPSRAD